VLVFSSKVVRTGRQLTRRLILPVHRIIALLEAPPQSVPLSPPARLERAPRRTCRRHAHMRDATQILEPLTLLRLCTRA